MDIRKGNTIALYKRIAQIFKEEESFTLQDLYDSMPDEKQETLRARVYEKLGKVFVRIGRGLYKVIEGVYVTLKGDNSCITIHGDGRDLSMIKSNSIDAQIEESKAEIVKKVLDKKMKEHSTKINAKMNDFLKSVKEFEQDVRRTAVDEIRETQSEIPEGFVEYLEQKKLKDNIQEHENSDELLK